MIRKMLYKGRNSFLRKGSIYYVEVFSSADDRVYVFVKEPERTVTYQSIEDFESDWAFTLEPEKEPALPKYSRIVFEVPEKHVAGLMELLCRFVRREAITASQRSDLSFTVSCWLSDDEILCIHNCIPEMNNKDQEIHNIVEEFLEEVRTMPDE